MADSDSTQSPTWSPTTKLLVGLTVVAFITALVIYFRSIIGPLLLAFILAYSLHPIVARIDRGTRLGWRGSVVVVYFVLVVILLALLTLLGFAFVQQVQSLLSILNFITENLPQQVEQLSHQIIIIGPFQLNLSQFDLGTLANQLLSVLQPTLVRMGTLVSGFAAGTLVTLGWGLFVLVISYFLLAEAGRVRNDLIQLDIPGYNTDVQRLSLAFRRIWQVFLRGQLVIFFLAILLYTILLTVLGVRYSLAIAIMAGLARFIPYVGPFIVWVVLALVSLLQGYNYFGLQAWAYTLVVLGLAILLDQILDNIVVPMFHGETLGVHPAAVLVAAIVAANLIGFVGLVLAAPVLASLVLLGRYIIRKMLDLDPWPSLQYDQRAPEFPWAILVERSRIWWQRVNRQ
ncbi:MAG TPA: AI-2E family transporter [Anaerolineales bacterium]|nr:AI-2E family transporter [Anaerolineales bacterium]